MMKKSLAIFLSMFLLFSFCACSKSLNEKVNEEPSTTQSTTVGINEEFVGGEDIGKDETSNANGNLTTKNSPVIETTEKSSGQTTSKFETTKKSNSGQSTTNKNSSNETTGYETDVDNQHININDLV